MYIELIKRRDHPHLRFTNPHYCDPLYQTTIVHIILVSCFMIRKIFWTLWNSFIKLLMTRGFHKSSKQIRKCNWLIVLLSSKLIAILQWENNIFYTWTLIKVLNWTTGVFANSDICNKTLKLSITFLLKFFEPHHHKLWNHF